VPPVLIVAGLVIAILVVGALFEFLMSGPGPLSR